MAWAGAAKSPNTTDIIAVAGKQRLGVIGPSTFASQKSGRQQQQPLLLIYSDSNGWLMILRFDVLRCRGRA